MRQIKTLNEKTFILASFVSLYAFKLLYSTIYSQESPRLTILRSFGLFIFSFLAFLAYKGNNILTLIMAIIILVSGLGCLAAGLLISWDQVGHKIFFLFAGILFSYGGVRLFHLGSK